MTQHQKKKERKKKQIKKMARGPEQKIFQGQHKDGQQAHEKL